MISGLIFLFVSVCSAEAFPDLATALKAPTVPPPAPVAAAAPVERPQPFGSSPFGSALSREREAPVDPVVSSIFGSSTGERPRLKLAPRTLPVPEVVVTPVEPEPTAPAIAEAPVAVADVPAAAAPVEAEAEAVKPVEKKKKKKKAAFGDLDLDDLNI
jgi:hypothetical protein